ncbi:Cro/CI family transcriptional regulator [Klebsiella sp. NPDC088457]
MIENYYCFDIENYLFGVDMLKTDVIAFYGGRGAISHIAALMGLTHGAVSQWPALIPKGAALELEKLTNGALKCDLSLYRERPRKNKLTKQVEARHD